MTEKSKGKKTGPKRVKHEPLEDWTPQHYEYVRAIVRALSANDPVVHKHLRKAGMSPKGAIDISQIFALIQQFGPYVIPLIEGWFKKKPPQPTPTPTPVPAPPSPSPTPGPTPTPAPAPAPSPSARRVASVRCHWIGWEDYSKRPGESHPFHHSIGGGGISSGNELAGAGYRGHADVTPLDQFGQPFYADDVLKQPATFCKEPGMAGIDERNNSPTCGEGNNRINHWIIVDGREYGPQGDMVPGTPWDGQDVAFLTSEYDQAAMTPVIAINVDLPLSVEHTVAYRGDYVAPDGTIIRGQETPTIHVKAWGV